MVLAVKGDFGAGTSAQAAVTKRMCRERSRTPFRYVITTGDNFYDPDGRATAENFTKPEACLLAYAGHRWWATWGNHDIAGSSTETKLGARRYQHRRLPGIDVILLDSNRPRDAEQRRWLKRTLSRAAGPVKIAVFHHPPYTVGSAHPNDAGVQNYWVPLFEQYGVDLVLNGHAHLYEHHRRNGIDYVVTGGGGRALHSCAREIRSLILCRKKYHFLIVTIGDRTIEVRAVLRDGSTLDRFSIAA